MPQPPAMHSLLCDSWAQTYKTRNEEDETQNQLLGYQKVPQQPGPPGSPPMKGAISPRRTPLLPVSQQCPSPGILWMDTMPTHGAMPVYCTMPLPQESASPPEMTAQWVLPETSGDNSPSPEVIHLCKYCDAEFFSVSDLTLHSRMCAATPRSAQFIPRIIPLKKQAIARKRHNIKIIPPPKTLTSLKLQPLVLLRPIITKKQNHIFEKPPEITLPTKNEFLASFGLKSHLESPKKRTVQMPVSEKSIATLYRQVPFSLLPKELRLRSNSFFPSRRKEESNAQLIESNWIKVDKACAAYPACHSKFQDFTLLPPPPLASSCRSKRVSAQALAIKRQMRQPRLVLPRLKAREIRLARTGANTQALLRKYAACARQQRPPPRQQLVKPSQKTMPAASTASPSASDVFELKSMREFTVPSPMTYQAPTFDGGESPAPVHKKIKGTSQSNAEPEKGLIDLKVALQYIRVRNESTAATTYNVLQPVVRLRRLELTRLHPVTIGNAIPSPKTDSSPMVM